MKTFTLKTKYATYKHCRLVYGKYRDGNLAVMLENNEDGPIANITVNLGGELPEGFAHIDTNNLPEAEQFLTENDLAEFTGFTKQSCFCTYPVYEFNMEKLKKEGVQL